MLPTLTKGGHILFSKSLPSGGELDGRWFLALELLQSQGWPITPEHVPASGGIPNSFSRGVPAPESRPRHSLVGQAGNATNVILFVAIASAFLVRSPSLGRRVRRARPLSLFSELKRRRLR